MKLSLNVLADMVLLLFIAALLLQMIGLEEQIGAAQSYFCSIIDALEESAGSTEVLSACRTQASREGYDLSVHIQSDTCWFLEMHYELTAPVFGGRLTEGKVRGYACF